MPLVRQFYGVPYQYIWEDDEGTVHDIPLGEGEEQGDALMPALVSLGQHSALNAVAEELRPCERLLAFLDDIYVVCAQTEWPPLRFAPEQIVAARGDSGECGEDTIVESWRSLRFGL